MDLLWLLTGSLLLVFMGGKWNVPVATWLGPVFLLRFFRVQRHWVRTLLALPALAVAMAVFMIGLLPFPPVVPVSFYLFRTLGYALLIATPYAVDRALYPLVPQPWNILVFPSAATLFHFLLARFGPTGTAAIWGQNLFGSTALLQVVSITGVWGLSFLVGWFASTANALWQSDFSPGRLRAPLAAFGAAMALVLLWGGFCLAILKPALCHPPSPRSQVTECPCPGIMGAPPVWVMHL